METEQGSNPWLMEQENNYRNKLLLPLLVRRDSLKLHTLKHAVVFGKSLPNIQTHFSSTAMQTKFQFNVSDKPESLEASFGSSTSFTAPQFQPLLGFWKAKLGFKGAYKHTDKQNR